MEQIQPMTIALVGMIVAVVALAVWALMRRNRSERLARRFGPEYERVVNRVGDKTKAEAELDARARRREALRIVPLPADERERFARDWASAQARFVDDPTAAIAEADRLVEEVMNRRGYPMAEFEQRAADISVDHPRTVETYRAAHALAIGSQRGEVSTEDLRQAMVHYRELFAELLGTPEPELVAAGR
jgi:hypothetical protein